jgi:multidrug resistance efflux pump
MREIPEEVTLKEHAVAEARAAVESAKHSVTYAVQAHHRSERMKNVEALQEREKTDAQAHKMEAELRRAEELLHAAEAALDVARTQFGFYTTYSPIDGVITKMTAKPGDESPPGRYETIFGEVLDTSVVDILCGVEEKDIDGITLGSMATIKKGPAELAGTVVFISPEVTEDKDGKNPKVGVLVRVKNPNGKLRINTEVTVMLQRAS